MSLRYILVLRLCVASLCCVFALRLCVVSLRYVVVSRISTLRLRESELVAAAEGHSHVAGAGIAKFSTGFFRRANI